MKRIRLIFLSIIFTCLAVLLNNPVSVNAFMSDKTEIPVDLEVSGAEALCQTDDGYVWIAQYSGLTRYDSKEYVTYNSFTEGDKEYSIINVRALANDGDILYIATYNNIFVYKDHQFSCLNINAGVIKDIALDTENDLLYISSIDEGATLYDIKANSTTKLPNLETGNVNDIALDVKRNNYYYQTNAGVFDKSGNQIYVNDKILDIYSHGDILYCGDVNGLIKRYNMNTGTFLADINIIYKNNKNEDTGEQINKFLYSEADKTLFVACETNGLYCVDLSGNEPVISSAGNLKNKSQLVDLMIDYQGNLWVASHYNGASGVSFITRNALSNLLYDDPTWATVAESDRKIHAIERYGDILYIMCDKRLFMYDLNTNVILPENEIMGEINAYILTLDKAPTISFRDMEVFKDKIYFAVYGIGLVEYNPTTKDVVIYDGTYIANHTLEFIDDEKDNPNAGEPSLGFVYMRALRAFDNYLAITFTQGIQKFDGENFTIRRTSTNSVLYITKTNDGKMVYNRTAGIYKITDDFQNVTKLPLIEGVTGSVLKVLVDGDSIYYNLNSRLFRMQKVNGEYVSKEIAIPYIKGSITELSKIAYKDSDNSTHYKYIIASQTQIYITNSLDVDRLDEYEFYDATNGLKDISANTSGYYDVEAQKYYFQSTNGVFVYDFNEKVDVTVPVKIDVASIELDGVARFGNVVDIKKDVYRVIINLSVFGFKPNKGYTIHYKLDGVDDEYHTISDTNDRNINYTNLPGGSYRFHAYALDEYGQKSNEIIIELVKDRKMYEHIWFWVVVAILGLGLIILVTFFIIHRKTQQSIRKQLEYKNITVESIQAIARTIDAKDEYTNGHSIRVGYYSKLIAQNLGMKDDEVDNIYYIALLHDIGKIAIPDSILNKPGKLTDEEFAIMKSHTTRGAKILEGISTIPQIIEGAKSHHEKCNGMGYPEGLKGEEIPFVARIICCADCFDAMASKRVYKEPFPLDDIINEFKRCSGTQFDPKIAEVVVEMMENGKLKPYSAENTYLGKDGKTHRIKKDDSIEEVK